VAINRPDTGSGGGGRVAVVLTSGSAFGAVDYSARGGTIGSSGASAPGTVYLESSGDGSGGGRVIVDDKGEDDRENTYLPSQIDPNLDELKCASLVVTNGDSEATISASVTLGDLYVYTGTTLDLAGYDLTVNSCEHALGGGSTINAGSISWICSEGAVAKSASDATPDAGDTITYTVTATNESAVAATEVQVTDNLPSGVTYVGDDSGGTYSTNTDIWTVGNLAAMDSATLTITVTVDPASAGLSITNTASISIKEGDTNAVNDTALAVIDVTLVDLIVVKTVDNNVPQLGQTFVYTIAVSNAGPDAASGVQLTDALPAGITYVSDGSGGAYSTNTDIWTAGAVGAGSQATLAVTAQVAAAGLTITNVAYVSAVDQAQVTTGNDTGSVIITTSSSGISSVSESGPDDIEIRIAGTDTAKVYMIVYGDEDGGHAKSMLQVYSNPVVDPLVITDPSVLTDAGVTSRYYQLVVFAGGIPDTNDVEWVVQKQARGSNRWHMVSAPVEFGDASQNRLSDTLGTQIGGGLIPEQNQSTAPNLWAWDYTSGTWSNFWLFTNHTWYTTSSDPADFEIKPGHGVWIKTQNTDPGSSNTVFIGTAHTNVPDAVTLVSNRWILFSWPFSARQTESAGGGGNQGWGFSAQGGTEGTGWSDSDRMFMEYEGSFYNLYLGSGSRWYIQNTTTLAPVALMHGKAYYYFSRGPNFDWTATPAN